MDPQRDLELASLLVRAQDGDKLAYERFLEQIARILRAYLRKRLRDIDQVEDVVQDTLMSVHRVRQTYQPGKPVGPWLYAICESRRIDFLRKVQRIQSREVPWEDEFIDLWASSDEDAPDNADERITAVQAALANLPEKQKRIIYLLKIEELSVKEVAARIGISESSVKVTAFRGYEAIRKQFKSS